LYLKKRDAAHDSGTRFIYTTSGNYKNPLAVTAHFAASRVALKCCHFHSHLHRLLSRSNPHINRNPPKFQTIFSDNCLALICAHWTWFWLAIEDSGLNRSAYLLANRFGPIQSAADAALFIALLMQLFTCVIKLPVAQ